MKNFIFKSTAADLQKMFSILDNLQKNMLYITYKVDAIIKLVKSQVTDNKLQETVDEYFTKDEEASFEDNAEHIPDEKQDLD